MSFDWLNNEKNSVLRIRPKSTFESFELLNDSLTNAHRVLFKLAERILQKKDQICTKDKPFENALMLFIHGPTGVGKTHLLEALINHLKQNSADDRLLSKIVFYCDRFSKNYFPIWVFKEIPIVIIDDFYSQFNSVFEVSEHEIKFFMEFIMDVYEKRALVIINSNFPVKGHILNKVKAIDKVGRVTSRLKEILSTSGEIEIVGEDYREKLAEQKQDKELWELI